MVTSILLGTLLLMGLLATLHAWRKKHTHWFAALAGVTLVMAVSFVDHTFYSGEILNFIVELVNSSDQPQQ